jgi:hypothetical protein
VCSSGITGSDDDEYCSFAYGAACGSLIAGSCPSAGLTGCCALSGAGGSCYYGTSVSEANAKSGCTGGSNGTWTTTAP